jgi:NitT/TauT family transport system permease protein
VWSSRVIGSLVTPTAIVLSAVPITVLIPIIARVIGYGGGTLYIIVAIVTFFPAFVLVGTGLTSIPASSRDLFRVLGASQRGRLQFLNLPQAVPNFMIALRVTAPGAILAELLAEFLVGGNGLGQLFSDSRSYGDTDRAWGAAIVATVVSVVVFVASRALERIVAPRFR